MSNEGCWVQDFSQNELICACNHLTDFIGFVEAGYSPLLKSNYNAFTALPTLKFHSLSSNTGLILSYIYFGTYLAFLLVGSSVLKKKNKTEEKLALLFLELNLPTISKYEED